MAEIGPAGGAVVDVVLESPVDGKRKKVTFDQIRPLAVDRPVLVLPKVSADYEVLDVVVYCDGSDFRLGMVMEVGPEKARLTIQELEGLTGKSGVTWLPMWRSGDEKSKDVKRKMKCPVGFVADIRTIDYEMIAGLVCLDGRSMLTQESKNFLDAKGFQV